MLTSNHLIQLKNLCNDIYDINMYKDLFGYFHHSRYIIYPQKNWKTSQNLGKKSSKVGLQQLSSHPCFLSSSELSAADDHLHAPSWWWSAGGGCMRMEDHPSCCTLQRMDTKNDGPRIYVVPASNMASFWVSKVWGTFCLWPCNMTQNLTISSSHMSYKKGRWARFS